MRTDPPVVARPTVPSPKQLRCIARRYAGRWLQGYAHGKLRSDPAFAAIAATIAAAPAPVLDIGCGIGLLAQYLLACGCRVPYLGVDIDERKIRSAQRAAPDMPDSHFECSGCDSLAPWQGHVVMLDVLHYLEADVQSALLQAAAGRVAPGAALSIRTVLRDGSWRFAATRVEEFVIRSSRWIPGGARHYPARDGLRAALAESGLDISITPLYGRTPFNSYLVMARRAPVVPPQSG